VNRIRRAERGIGALERRHARTDPFDDAGASAPGISGPV
jgi:hypothetical protein